MINLLAAEGGWQEFHFGMGEIVLLVMALGCAAFPVVAVVLLVRAVKRPDETDE
jgi:hypothetical protein